MLAVRRGRSGGERDRPVRVGRRRSAAGKRGDRRRRLCDPGGRAPACTCAPRVFRRTTMTVSRAARTPARAPPDRRAPCRDEGARRASALVQRLVIQQAPRRSPATGPAPARRCSRAPFRATSSACPCSSRPTDDPAPRAPRSGSAPPRRSSRARARTAPAARPSAASGKPDTPSRTAAGPAPRCRCARSFTPSRISASACSASVAARAGAAPSASTDARNVATTAATTLDIFRALRIGTIFITADSAAFAFSIEEGHAVVHPNAGAGARAGAGAHAGLVGRPALLRRCGHGGRVAGDIAVAAAVVAGMALSLGAGVGSSRGAGAAAAVGASFGEGAASTGASRGAGVGATAAGASLGAAAAAAGASLGAGVGATAVGASLGAAGAVGASLGAGATAVGAAIGAAAGAPPGLVRPASARSAPAPLPASEASASAPLFIANASARLDDRDARRGADPDPPRNEPGDSTRRAARRALDLHRRHRDPRWFPLGLASGDRRRNRRLTGALLRHLTGGEPRALQRLDLGGQRPHERTRRLDLDLARRRRRRLRRRRKW